MTRKQTVGENLLYVMVWAAIILVPVLNSQMMSELHISFENVLIAWRQIAPYFIIFIIVLQQLEGNLIYPKVVGKSVGLPGIWVLVSVTVGGDAFGVMGMLVGVPICSVAYTLAREFIRHRVERKQQRVREGDNKKLDKQKG